MNGRQISKLVHEGIYLAEAEVETIFADDGWSPYLSIEDAYPRRPFSAQVGAIVSPLSAANRCIGEPRLRRGSIWMERA